MKQSTKTLLLIIGLVVLLAAATVGYRALTAEYGSASLEQMQPAQPAETGEIPEEPAAEQDAAAESDPDPAPAAEPEATPSPAPDFTVYTADGAAVKLSDFRGKPVVINFWATWCGPCKSELPAFDRAYAAYGEDVAFMMVNLTDGQRETVEGVGAFLKDGGYAFPVYYDTAYSAANTYGVYSIPMTFLIDKEGNVVGGQVGVVSEAALLSALEMLKAMNG